MNKVLFAASFLPLAASPARSRRRATLSARRTKSGVLMGFSPAKLIGEYGRTIKVCAISLITISAMLAIGTLIWIAIGGWRGQGVAVDDRYVFWANYETGVIYRRAKAGFSATEEQAAGFKKFVTGTELFSRQHLYGEHFLAIPLVIAIKGTTDKGTSERTAILANIDGIISELEQHPEPLTRLRKVGQPYVNDYLDKDTRETGIRYFPLFFLFVTVLCVALYRSWRTLLAFIITLGMSAAMTVGFVGITGGVFTIVSSLVPMTILITCTATLVYLQSRFVDRPPERSVDDHQIFALCNKFLACTASIFAAAVGFAALAVSRIRPIREMGLWVAVGLVFTWLLVFTLFPALQKLLHTPTRQEQHGQSRWFVAVADFVPRFSFRFRFVLVPVALVMCGLGAIALLGLPGGLLPPMTLQTNPVDYINHDSEIYKNTKELEKNLGGLAVTFLVGACRRREVVGERGHLGAQ